jgi:hypothetical protein
MSSKDNSTRFSGKTTATAESNTATEEPKKSYDKLLTKLNGRGISLLEFAHVDEKRRKKMLKDDYQDIKNETGWLYDEVVEIPATVYEKEKQLNDEKAKK